MVVIKKRLFDQTSAALLFRWGFVWVAWATLPNDPWRDEEENEVHFGMIRHRGKFANGRALVIKRLKIGVAIRNKEESR
jgi:hypothetical protein